MVTISVRLQMTSIARVRDTTENDQNGDIHLSSFVDYMIDIEYR